MRIKDNSGNFMAEFERKKRSFLSAAAVVVSGQAKELCPVKTGNLRNSIGFEIGDDIARIGTPVEYAPHIEIGTVKMNAQPYLRPALDIFVNGGDAKRLMESA